jgi:hypothetical protein
MSGTSCSNGFEDYFQNKIQESIFLHSPGFRYRNYGINSRHISIVSKFRVQGPNSKLIMAINMIG